MAANQLPQDPAIREAFKNILNATDNAANVEHTRLNYLENLHRAAKSSELTSTLENLNAVIDKKLQTPVSSPATLFSQSAGSKNLSSEANNSSMSRPSNS